MSSTRLARAMEAKGLKGTELARTLKISEVVVSEWKHGRRYVPQKHREPLAEILDVPAEELFDERGIPKLVTEGR
jgi:transcriptional regulator with XRE-family HTH domain